MPRIKGMPGPYRFFFTSFDCNEPPHVHVERENATCKFWLEPVGLARSHGFGAGVEQDATDHCSPPRHDIGGMA